MFGFNRPYVRNNRDIFCPVYYPGENYSLYINSIISDEDYSHFVIQLIDTDDNVIANLSDLVDSRPKVLFVRGAYGYNLYKDNFVFPVCKEGFYYIRIWNDDKNYEVIRTQPIVSTSSGLYQSTEVKFRHNDQLYGVRYDLLPNFYQKYRLPISQIKPPKISSTREQYRESSNGRLLRNSKSFRDIILTLEFYWSDDEDFAGVSAMLEHDEIYISGNKIIDMTQVVIEKPDEKSKLSKGNFEVIVDDYNFDSRKIENYGDFLLRGGNTFTKDNSTFIDGNI